MDSTSVPVTSLDVRPIDRWNTFWRHRVPLILTHPVPRTHWTVYIHPGGHEEFCLWKQWGKRVYGVTAFEIKPFHID